MIESRQGPIMDPPSRTGTITVTNGRSSGGRVTGPRYPGRSGVGALGLGVGSFEPLRPRLGSARGRRVLPVCGTEQVLDGDVGTLAGVGLGEAAAGGLDVADLLRERAVRVGLGSQFDAVADQGQLQVALESAALAA